MLAIDRVMYADDTKPENLQICWEACLLLIQWCLTRMIPSLKIHRFAEQYVYYWSSSVGDDTQLENLWLCWAVCLLSTELCTEMILSLKICEFAKQHAYYWPSSVREWYQVQKFANLLSSVLVIDRAVYGNDTESEKLQFYWATCLLLTEWCRGWYQAWKFIKFAEQYACYQLSGLEDNTKPKCISQKECKSYYSTGWHCSIHST